MPRKRWPPSAVLKTPEAAHHVGLAASTLEKARVVGGGPPWVVILKGAIRYRVSDLDEWLAARVTGRPETRCADCPLRRREEE
ncbi:helix-turn-helix transcriptional regulator [Sphingomonas sp. TX0543]|uniref:helix-turn-helix transcriptional regulator n=1 Tax=unclassified Sphingomonas TaxID=196159 RepID=UPI0010F66440|nr:helix-turn-helix domain-containing protein [Sphingomonas sp. 3P27F8]